MLRHWDEHPRTVVFAHAGLGKTAVMVRRLVHEIGTNPEIKIGYVSSVDSIPVQVVTAVARMIKGDPRVHRVFPRLRPAEAGVWSGEDILVDRTSNEITPTLRAAGQGTTIEGQRWDVVVLDDVASHANTITKHSRDKITQWVSTSLLSRQSRTARVHALSNVHHKDDVVHVLAYQRGFARLRLPAETKGHPTVPEMFTTQWAARQRTTLGSLGSAAMVDLVVLDDAKRRIKAAWVEQCMVRGLPVVERWNPADAPTITAVDVATGKGRDRTVLVTIAVLPAGFLRVLKVESCDVTGPEILERVTKAWQAFGSLVVIENNGAQSLLIDHAPPQLQVARFTTTAKNRHGVTGLDHVGLQLEQRRISIPADHDGQPADEGIAELVRACLEYAGPETHTPDALQAMWMAVHTAHERFVVEELPSWLLRQFETPQWYVDETNVADMLAR